MFKFVEGISRSGAFDAQSFAAAGEMGLCGEEAGKGRVLGVSAVRKQGMAFVQTASPYYFDGTRTNAELWLRFMSIFHFSLLS